MPTTRNGDCTISYETVGDGPPLVMVYGIGGNSRGWWDEFPRLLAAHYRLVMLDNRGTGNSDKPKEPWTMSDMTGDIQAVVDAVELDTFHLLGCSLGTVIARQYVRERGGGKLRSLSLPNGISATPRDLNTALFWDRNKPLIDSARASWPIIHPTDWIAANDAALVENFEQSMREPTPVRTFQFQLKATGDAPDPNPSLNDYAWPVLIAHGSIDRLVPPGNAFTLHDAVPRARLELLKGDSHNFWSHDPQRSARIVLDFLDAAETAAR
jgi:3-oxoadipate enol-lactonase